MYRILKANKDGYVTNKIIRAKGSSLTSSVDSNVGQAGTIDIFKLYNEPSGSGIQLSRGLIKFDTDELKSLTGSILNYNDSSFKAYVRMKNVYGGQSVPSNYTLSLFPLAKDWSEGRGIDVVGYRDLDSVNWLTASTNPSITYWTSGGIEYGAAVGTSSADYYTSIPILSGSLPLEFTQSFARGDEDLFIDVTPAIKFMLSGSLPDNGFRLSFTGSQEADNVTRFVKRFSTKQSRNTNLHPALVVKYDDSFIDNQAQAFFDYPNKIGIYNKPFSVATNFFSGSTEIVGSGSLLLTLLASASQYVTATTYSISHQATISYQSASWVYFSASFTGSQIQLGGLNQTGSYYADVYIPSKATGLENVLQGNNSIYFTSIWSSLDNTIEYFRNENIQMKLLQGSNSNVIDRNYVVNVTNLKNTYINTDIPRLRVFVYDFDPTLTSFYLPYKANPRIFKTMYWRLIDPYTKEELIPFDDIGTKLSSDGEGMYFDLYMNDLPLNKPLEIELLIKEGAGSQLIEDQRFIFKVVNK